MTDLKFEEGKAYRTRGGWKATVVKICPDARYPVTIWHDYDKSVSIGCVSHHLENGKVSGGRGEDSSYDITSEWKELRVGYMNVYRYDKHGLYLLVSIPHLTRKEADNNASPRRVACIKVTEGQFDD